MCLLICQLTLQPFFCSFSKVSSKRSLLTSFIVATTAQATIISSLVTAINSVSRIPASGRASPQPIYSTVAREMWLKLQQFSMTLNTKCPVVALTCKVYLSLLLPTSPTSPPSLRHPCLFPALAMGASYCSSNILSWSQVHGFALAVPSA